MKSTLMLGLFTPVLLASSHLLAAEVESNVEERNVLQEVSAKAPVVPAHKIYGLNFSPYLGKQDPNTGVVISESQVWKRLSQVKDYCECIRTFSTTHGMENVGAMAHQLGLKVYMGAWIGKETTAEGLAANQAEVANLIAACKRGEVDVAVVGSEVSLRGDVTVARLISYVNQVRAAIPSNIPVSLDDTYDVLINNPSLIAASDVVFANFYPYWEGVGAEGAMYSMNQNYSRLKAVAGSKEVIVGESGHPSAGAKLGQAVPNANNAAYYFQAFESWAKDYGVKTCYFSDHDEAWKANYGEGVQGAHWGIFDASGAKLKKGMAAVFAGYTLPSEIYLRQSPALAVGQPTVRYTHIPAYGSTENLEGMVTGVAPASYKVANFINVNGGWWTKPTYSTPTVAIAADGRWSCDVTTGGYDTQATGLASFVVPTSYTPPTVGGSGGLPGSLYANAITYTNFVRPVNYPGGNFSVPVSAIKSLSIVRNFANPSGDSVSLSGTLAAASVPTGSTVEFDVGGAKWVFQLSAKNVATNVLSSNLGNARGTVSLKPGKGSTTFNARLWSATHSQWNDEGLYDWTLAAPGIPVRMNVAVKINDEAFGAQVSGYYNATQGNEGMMSKATSLGIGY